jgi:hypothetical protein
VENNARLELEKDLELELVARNVGSRYQPYGAACARGHVSTC